MDKTKQDNLKALQTLAKKFSVDNIVTQDAVEEILKGILSIIVSYKKSNEKLNSDTIQVVDQLYNKILREQDQLEKSLSNNVDDKLESTLNQVKNLVAEFEKIRPKNGENGLDADEEVIVSKVLEQIKLPEYEVYSLEEKGEDMVKEINALPTDEDEYKIDASHIKNLPESKGNFNGGGWRNLYQMHDVELSSPTDNQVLTYDSASNTWKNETPSGGSVGPGTINELAYFDSTTSIASLAVATYPSLTELSYVKGLTSALQTQLNAKQASDTQLTSLAGLTYAGNGGKFIRVNAGETDFELAAVSGSGTVTSVAMTVPTGLTITGSPVTTTGTLAVALDTGYVIPLQTTLDALAPKTSPTFATSITGSYLTASEILITDASKNIVSAPVATYPSLTELSYVKGVTSAIQTQLNAKQATITFGTGVQTALGVNIGSAGAPVLFNGAGGTPSSLTGTNITGTASGLTAGAVTNATLTTALTVNGGTLTLTANVANTSVLTIGAGAVSVSGANTGDQTTVSGNAGTATTLQNTRTIWGQNFNGSANVTGTLALGTADLTLTGSIGATGARATKVWTAALESTALPTINGGTLASALGLAITAAKTLTVSNSLTLAGTDATVMTFPSTSATIARTDAANTFTGVQTFSTPIAAGSVATMTATVGGGVPTPPNNTTTFLRGDGTFAAPAGGGGWVLVENGAFSGANSETIDDNGSSLAGDTNEIFMLVIKAVFSTADRLQFKFNAIGGTGYNGSVSEITYAGAETISGRQSSAVAYLTDNNSYKEIFVNAMVYTKTSYSKQIVGTATAYTAGGTSGAAFNFGASLDDQSTAITAFTILSMNGNNFQTGSEWWLYKKS